MARTGSAGTGRQFNLASLQARLRAIDSEREQVLGQIRKFIDHAKRLIESRAVLGVPEKAGTGKRRRPRLSAEARKRISDAQKRRWAATRAQTKKKH